MLFRKKIDPRCAYCTRAGRIDDGRMICKKRGIVPAEDKCRRFRYDPLKRVPARPKPHRFGEFRPEDFQL